MVPCQLHSYMASNDKVFMNYEQCENDFSN
jgi:hypothetical protein